MEKLIQDLLPLFFIDGKECRSFGESSQLEQASITIDPGGQKVLNENQKADNEERKPLKMKVR